MVLITSACGEGSDEPACTHDPTRAFASRINKVCKLKKTPTSSLSGDARMNDYKRLDQISSLYAFFFMIKILNPCPAELLLVIDYYCIRLKNQTSFAMQTEFEESANLPSPKTFTTYPSRKMKCSRFPAEY